MVAEFDVVVIGGGPAGYSLAIRLAGRGKRVACVERERVGGVCLNWGCIPSKALITTAQRYVWAKEGEEMGVKCLGVELDLPQAQRRNRGIVAHHTGGVEALLRSNRAELLAGQAELLGGGRVRVSAPDGSARELIATEAVVIATGARPRELPGLEPDGRHVVTAREGVFLERLPEHLIVVGGGIIGVELGSAYQKLGARLSIIEIGDALLPGVDPDLVRVVQRRLVERGARIALETRVLSWQASERGVQLTLSGPDGEFALEGSLMLVAAGFVPNSAGLGLDRLGVKLDRTGHISIDERCQSSVPGIYAIGDVAGPPYLAHKAYKEAEVLAEVLSGKRVVRDIRALPSVIFSDPEIATVGLSEARARAEEGEIGVGKFPFSALGRAQALGESEGFVKLLARNDRLIGAGVVGPEASELIAELTLAIEVGASLEDLALTVHAHPTLAEAVHEAAEQGLGQAVHVLNRARARQRPPATAASI